METITAKQIQADFMLSETSTLTVEDQNRLSSIGYIQMVPEKLQAKFPLRKIIHDNRAGKLIEKYGLAISKLDRFVDFIPEKNIKELLEFDKQFDYYNFYERDGVFRKTGWHTIERPATYKNVSNLWKSHEYLIIAAKEMILPEPQRAPLPTTIQRIKDPIIIASMISQSGYNGWNVIVTAWGDEANIEEFQNPANN